MTKHAELIKRMESVKAEFSQYSKEAAAVQDAIDALQSESAAVPDDHELWAVAQLVPGEGIEDGVARIEDLLKSQPASTNPLDMRLKFDCGECATGCYGRCSKAVYGIKEPK